MPTQNEKEQLLSKVVLISEKLYTVPSVSNSELTCTVDMNVGVCECHEGQNGSVCKHQYLLWVSHFENATNFLTFLGAQERQKYAEIAIGNFYEGTHDRVREPFQANKSHNYEESVNPTLNTKPSCSSSETPDTRRSIEVLTAQKCKAKLQKALSLLESKIETNCNDLNFLRGVDKFCERVVIKFPLSKLSSSLHSFGVPYSTSLKVTATATLNKARKGQIYVQPGR